MGFSLLYVSFFFLEFISFGVLFLPTYLEAREIRDTSAKKITSVILKKTISIFIGISKEYISNGNWNLKSRFNF